MPRGCCVIWSMIDRFYISTNIVWLSSIQACTVSIIFFFFFFAMLISQPASLSAIKLSQPNPPPSSPNSIPLSNLSSSNGKNPSQPFDQPLNTQNLSHLIRQKAREKKPHEALNLFRSMISFSSSEEETNPNSYPISTVLGCCGSIRGVGLGKEIHGFMVRRSLYGMNNCSNQSSLVDFYAKCGFLLEAREVFDRMLERDVVAWTIILMAYSGKNGNKNQLMVLFVQMLYSGVAPNSYTITVLIPHVDLQQGKQIHGYIIKNNLDSDNFVGTALLDLYARNRKLKDARLVLSKIKNKDIVCYNSLLSCLGKLSSISDLIELFIEMAKVDLKPTQSTFVSLINGCAICGFIGPSRQFHAQSVIRGFNSDEMVQSAILDMYAKCGDLKSARLTFNKIKNFTKNVVIWNTMIGGYGKHGCIKEALDIFSKMTLYKIKPNEITFICLLSACSHAGWVDEGWQIFNAMDHVYGIKYKNEHYCCMVDLLGRAGLLREAYEFICNYKCEYRPSAWGALLSACRVWGNKEIGEIASRRLYELEPDSSGSYVAMASIYASKNMWSESNNVRGIMEGRNVKKDAGFSLIEVGGAVRKFTAGENLSKESWFEEVYLMCDGLNKNMCEDFSHSLED